MQSRRSFVVSSAAALTAAGAQSAMGANDRLRLGVIGNGGRGTYVMSLFQKNEDVAVGAMCDVYKTNLERAVQTNKLAPGTFESYSDYRRVLDRKDIDICLVATPDHWHCPIVIDACQAGKDVYVEKPLSNEIEPCQRAVEAVKKYNRVVQVGIQQRGYEHYQKAQKMVRDGLLGQVYLVMLMYSGLYGGRAGQPTDPPEGLDWEMFQGPAPRRQYVPGRQRSWRSFYDYGGGLITDWGVHITDVAHWFMGDDMPRTASAAGQYVRYQPPPREEVPDTVSVSWAYDKFVMNLTSWEVPWLPPGLTNINTYGNIFVGTNGSLYVNRESYALLAPLRAGARGGASKPVESVSFRRPDNSDEGTINYVRNFLDCVKSRQKTIMDIETAYRSTVPTLLGRLAVRDGKMMAWDGTKASVV
jgi:predicted dehydrogenase